jgi:hypothetical protein
MKRLRLTEVLLPLLVARSRAPWLIELQSSDDGHALDQPVVATSDEARPDRRVVQQAPFDDVQ